ELLCQLARLLQLPLEYIETVESRQYPEELWGVSHYLAEHARPGIDLFHVRGRIAFGGLQRSAEDHLEVQLLPGALGGVWQAHEQLPSRGDVTHRLRIDRPLHRLLPGSLQILHRLPGVATATVMMRQFTVMIFESRGKERLNRLARPLV